LQCNDDLQEKTRKSIKDDVEFFFLDTCGCQDHVVRTWPEQVQQLQNNIIALRKRLTASTARWKFVFAHHLLYTQGFGHADSAMLLRETHEHNVNNTQFFRRKYDEKFGHLGCIGYGLEEVLIEGGVDAYFGGHEHVFQHIIGKGSIHHFCCGASGSELRPGNGFHRGKIDPIDGLQWVGGGLDYGFVSVEVSLDSCVVTFHRAMPNETGQEVVLHNVEIRKGNELRSEVKVLD
jgi:hypothetical protein